MNKDVNRTILSIAGVILVFAIVVLANVIFTEFHGRIDCTENKIYTLTDNSKRIIQKLKSPVTIKFYYSRSNTRMPMFFKNYAKRAEDLLEEYKQAGGSKIIIKKFDPRPDSDAEDSAILDGVPGQMLKSGDKIYLGLNVSCLDRSEAIPFLAVDRENLLEYDITNAISQVTMEKKPVIGVISALPVLGEDFNPQMLQRGGMDRTKPWMTFQELKKTFEMKKLPMEIDTIGNDIELLLVVNPAGISDKTQFAIDQYILKGGRMIAFLDPKSFFAAARSKQDRKYAAKSSSNLEKLLKAWGISFDVNMTVADMVFGRRVISPQRAVNFTTVLDITKKGINKDNVETAPLNKLTMAFAGSFTGKPTEGLKKTVLIKSTENSDLVNTYTAENPEVSFRNFEADSQVYDLAIRLEGKFKTAFPDGAPEDKKKDKKDKKNAKKEDKKKDSLKTSVKDSVVILIADSDILVDEICVKVGSILGQKILIPYNDNLSFFQNLVDHMAGDSDLIGIRCRQATTRPFEKIKDLQAKAEQKFKEKITELEKDLKETERHLNELQRKKSKDQQYILSPEQQDALKKFQQKQANMKKDLKKYRKQLRKDIDALEIKWKWINIALMPSIVTIFGIGIAIYRKRRSSSK